MLLSVNICVISGSSGLTRQRYSTFDSSSSGEPQAFSAYDNPRLPVGDVPLPEASTSAPAQAAAPGAAGYVGGTRRIHEDVTSQGGNADARKKFPLEALARQGIEMEVRRGC